MTTDLNTGQTIVFFAALGIGIVAGLRAFTAPAIVSWAAHWQWLDLTGSHLAFLGTTAAVAILSILALGEIVADKLPKTPNRIKPGPLTGRILTGALSGTAIVVAKHQAIALGVILGGLGGIVGAFSGFYLRRAIVRNLNVPDIAIAFIEDAITIGGGVLIVCNLK